MPSITELATPKWGSRTVTANRKVPSALLRAANASSAGEFIRVGTWGVRVLFESCGNT